MGKEDNSQGTTTLMSAVTDALTQVMTWAGSVIDGLLSGELSALLPLFAIGIAISALMLGVKIIKSFIWGA